MSIGDIHNVNGEDFEVIWDGGEGLTADRETKTTGFWTAPKRIYNKKSDFWTKPRTKEPLNPEEVDLEDPKIEHFGETEPVEEV